MSKKLTKFNTFNNVSYGWLLEPEHRDTKASDFLPSRISPYLFGAQASYATHKRAETLQNGDKASEMRASSYQKTVMNLKFDLLDVLPRATLGHLCLLGNSSNS